MIVAICGLPGSGKSTLAAELARAMKAELVAWDEYETMTQRDSAQIADWLARGAPFAEIEAPGLVARLENARGLTVFDSLLGPAWPVSAHLPMRAIWLDCPADIALARKVLQMLPQAGAEWIAVYLQAYPAIIAPALKLQEIKVPKLCSITLDATLPADVLAQQAMSWLHSSN